VLQVRRVRSVTVRSDLPNGKRQTWPWHEWYLVPGTCQLVPSKRSRDYCAMLCSARSARLRSQGCILSDSQLHCLSSVWRGIHLTPVFSQPNRTCKAPALIRAVLGALAPLWCSRRPGSRGSGLHCGPCHPGRQGKHGTMGESELILRRTITAVC
jgi:hypothetical protein